MKKTIASIILIVPFVLSLNAQTKKKIPPAKAPVQAASLQSSLLKGKMVFGQYCAACHQADGSGVPGMNPPLSKTVYVLGDKTRLINILLKGFNEEVEIDDEIYSNVMPPLNNLTDQQIADVLTYVRNNFQNKAAAVTPAEVKLVRAKK